MLYADDILIIAPSVSELQHLVNICELELQLYSRAGYAITNSKKSCCLSIGPRRNIECSNITTASGDIIPWVDTIRYLGIYITRSVKFKCSLSNTKNAFIDQLMLYVVKLEESHPRKLSCTSFPQNVSPSILLYGLEVCPLTKAKLHLLDFAVTRFLMKLFKTYSYTFTVCCRFFGFKLSSDLLERGFQNLCSNA